MKLGTRSTLPWHVVGALLLLSTTMAASRFVAERVSEPLARPLDEISGQLADFAGVENPPLTEGVLRELKPTSYLSRTYRKPSLAADVFIAFYA